MWIARAWLLLACPPAHTRASELEALLMIRHITSSIAITVLLGCANEPIDASSAGLIGDPLAGIDDGERTAFEDGLDAFIEVETIDDGLGPVFNDTSCGVCHSASAPGGA